MEQVFSAICMKRSFFYLQLLAMSLLVAGESQAEQAGTIAPQSLFKSIYLTGKEGVWNEFPKSPSLGSAIDQGDLAILLAVQSKRSGRQIREAFHDKVYSDALVSEVLGKHFDELHPRISALLLQADSEAFHINSALKKKNHRLRPFKQHPVLLTPLFTDEAFSYPSGHSVRAEVQARLLGKLYPDKAEVLLNRAREIGDSRVIAGVHNVSDVEAGEELGDLIAARLLAAPSFLRDLGVAARLDGIKGF